MSKIRIAIVDDEPLAREYIRNLLSKHDDCEIKIESGNGKDAVKRISGSAVDLVFLDVQMPEMNGFEVIEKIGADKMPFVIFVTAYDKYALPAFEIHALDYLLKPFNESRFAKALERARNHLQKEDMSKFAGRLLAFLETYNSSSSAKIVVSELREAGLPDIRNAAILKYVKRIPVKEKDKVLFILTNDIDWIEAADYYIKIHTKGSSFLLRETLQKLETQLDPEKFVRIHRNAIVNLDKIEQITVNAYDKYAVKLLNGKVLDLSRRRKERIEKILGRKF